MLPEVLKLHYPTRLFMIKSYKKKTNKLTCVRLLVGRLWVGLSLVEAASRAKRVRSSLSIRAC